MGINYYFATRRGRHAPHSYAIIRALRAKGKTRAGLQNYTQERDARALAGGSSPSRIFLLINPRVTRRWIFRATKSCGKSRGWRPYNWALGRINQRRSRDSLSEARARWNIRAIVQAGPGDTRQAPSTSPPSHQRLARSRSYNMSRLCAGKKNWTMPEARSFFPMRARARERGAASRYFPSNAFFAPCARTAAARAYKTMSPAYSLALSLPFARRELRSRCFLLLDACFADLPKKQSGEFRERSPLRFFLPFARGGNSGGFASLASRAFRCDVDWILHASVNLPRERALDGFALMESNSVDICICALFASPPALRPISAGRVSKTFFALSIWLGNFQTFSNNPETSGRRRN